MGISQRSPVLNRKQETENRKRIGVLLPIFLVVCLAWGCGPAPQAPVIVFGSPDSPRMRQAIAGLTAHLEAERPEVVCVPQFGPEGPAQLRRLRERHPRLLVVLGTPALLGVARVEKQTPVVFAMVGNPYFTGAAYEPEHPEIHQENITGIASPPPLTAALKQGVSLLGAGPWGLLYDPHDGAAADLAQQFIKEAPGYGIQPLTASSSDADADAPALARLQAQGARVIYLPPAASAARYAPLVLAWGRQRRVMVVSGYPEGSHAGAALWVALDYRRLGEEAAALARQVLAGEKPSTIPIVESTPLRVEVDEALLRYWSGYPGMNSGRKGEEAKR